jgi:hypothetical protein
MAMYERYVSSSGSATNGGSSEGSADVSGTAGAWVTTDADTLDLSGDSPDLSGVSAGDMIYFQDATGGQGSAAASHFRITAVDDGADTVDVTPSLTNAGDLSGKTWAIGGALTLEAAVGAYTANERWNVKADGTYSISSLQTLSTAATDGNPVHWRGYTSTIGDGGRAVVSCSASSDGAFSLTGAGILFEGFDTTCTNSAVTYVYYSTAADSIFYRCNGTFDFTVNDWTVRGVFSLAQNTLCLECNAECLDIRRDCAGFRTTGTYVVPYVVGCRAKSCNRGFWAQGYGAAISVINSIAEGVVSASYGNVKEAAVYCAVTLKQSEHSHPIIVNNTFYNWPDGIQTTTTVLSSISIINNIFYNISDYAIQQHSTPDTIAWLIFNNAYGAVTSGFVSAATTLHHNTIALTADPFTDAAGGDFTLNSTSGGGADCKGVGAPTDIDQDGVQDNWLDVGALQVEVAAGGGDQWPYRRLRTIGV